MVLVVGSRDKSSLESGQMPRIEENCDERCCTELLLLFAVSCCGEKASCSCILWRRPPLSSSVRPSLRTLCSLCAPCLEPMSYWNRAFRCGIVGASQGPAGLRCPSCRCSIFVASASRRLGISLAIKRPELLAGAANGRRGLWCLPAVGGYGLFDCC